MEEIEVEDDEQVWVIGYYHRNNLGDDVFGWVFEKLIPQISKYKKVVLINADQLTSRLPLPHNVKAVIVGGGDMINAYFMKSLRPLLEKKHLRTCPIYAVGIGLPYPQLVQEGFLDGFDYIIHRSSQDEQFLLERFGNAQVHYSPDLAWFTDSDTLSNTFPTQVRHTNSTMKNATTKRIIVCLARPMCFPQDTTAYDRIVDGMARFLLQLASDLTRVQVGEKISLCGLSVRQRKNRKKKMIKKFYKYQLDFVPFQTYDKGEHQLQDDRVMNRDVVKRMIFLNKGNNLGNVTLHEASPQIDDLVDYFRQFDYAICSRFHAHIFSLIAQIPLISVNCTRKVSTLMTDAGLEDFTYELPVDQQRHYPLECDHERLKAMFVALCDREMEIKEKLARYAASCHAKISETATVLRNLLFYLPQPVTEFIARDPARLLAQFLVANRKDEISLVQGITPLAAKGFDAQGLNVSQEMTTNNDASLSPYNWPETGKIPQKVVSCLETSNLLHIVNDPRVEEILKPGGIKAWGICQSDIDRVVRLISMLLTKSPVSEYSWGIKENLLSDTYNLPEAFKWVFKHRMTESQKTHVAQLPSWKSLNPTSDGTRIVDMEYVRSCEEITYKAGIHRSGWDFVTSHLRNFHNPNAEEIFDGYLDETFGWRYEVHRDVGTIPFRRPWKGILHHTPEESFGENNLTRLFSRRAWIKSLSRCTGLITLSENLARWVRQQLIKLGFPSVPVLSVFHPTEFPGFDKCFRWDLFVEQPQHHLLQVGGWLRNTYAIYDFPSYISHYHFVKCALKGKGMDHYYLTEEQFCQFEKQFQDAWDLQICQISGHHHYHHNQATQTGQCDKNDDKKQEDSDHSCLTETGKTGPLGPDSIFCSSAAIVEKKYISPWINGAKEAALRSMREKYQSVQLIDHVENDMYDLLLSENVIFLNLKDCSAVNTVIECITRNTPLLVNPLPAVVEYLGPEYPLYYNDLEHAARLLIDQDRLRMAHEYLKCMNKTKLTVEVFLDNVYRFMYTSNTDFSHVNRIKKKLMSRKKRFIEK